MYRKPQVTPFAMLEKRSTALGDIVAGKFNAGVGRAINGTMANAAGIGALFSGEDATKAKNRMWNAGQEVQNAQTQRATQGADRIKQTAQNAVTGVANGITNTSKNLIGGASNVAGAVALMNGEDATQAKNNVYNAGTQAVQSGINAVANSPTIALQGAKRVADGVGNLAAGGISNLAGTSALLNGENATQAKNNVYNSLTANKTGLVSGTAGSGTSSTAAPAAAPTAAPAPAPQSGPTAAQMAQFQKGTKSSYDPNSWQDRNMMNSLMEGGQNWSDTAAARRTGQQRYAWANSGASKSASILRILGR